MYVSKQSIGRTLKELRLKNNLTQEQLAEKVGKHRSYIGRIETKNGENLKISTLIDIIEKGFDGKVKIEMNL